MSGRLESIAVAGVGPLRNVQLDLAALGPGLIALVGQNGAGKSTLLDLMCPGVWYRRLPSYGDVLVSSHMNGHGAVDVVYGGASRWHLALQGANRALIWRDEQLVADGLMQYDALIARHFPPPELTLATIYAVQGGAGGFFRLPEAARRSVMLGLLGLDRYDAWITQTGTLAYDIQKTLSTADGLLPQLRANVAEQARLMILQGELVAAVLFLEKEVVSLRYDHERLRTAVSARALAAAERSGRAAHLRAEREEVVAALAGLSDLDAPPVESAEVLSVQCDEVLARIEANSAALATAKADRLTTSRDAAARP